MHLALGLGQPAENLSRHVHGLRRHTGAIQKPLHILEIAVRGVACWIKADIEPAGGEPSGPRRRPMERHIGKSEPLRQILDERYVTTRLGQGAQQHVARRPTCAIEKKDAPAHGVFPTPTRVIRCTNVAAPKPLSMFTTPIPVAHELSIPRSAATPPKLAP